MAIPAGGGGGGLPVTADLLCHLNAAAEEGFIYFESDKTTWADLSGNENHYTQTTGNQSVHPTLEAEVLNGKSVVRFDGSQDLRSAERYLSDGDAAEVFLLLRPIVTDSSLAPFGFGSTTTYPDSGGFGGSGGEIENKFGHGGANPRSFEPSLDILGEWRILNCRADEDFYVCAVDGVVQETRLEGGAPDWTGLNEVYFVGRGQSGTSTRFEGDMAEMALYHRILTDDERASVLEYFNEAWALGIDL